MGKFIRGLLIVLVVLCVGGGCYQWHIYTEKNDLRSDALLYFAEEDYAKSIQYLNRALDKHSVFASKLNQDMKCYLAESYFQLKEYEKAEALYHEMQTSNSNNAMYYLLEGQCYASAGKYDQALTVYQKGWKKTQDPEFLKKICDIYIEQEDYDQALAYARQGAGKSGESGRELLFETIIIYEKSQDYAAAYNAAKKYCEQYPDDEEGKRELIFLSTRV